MADKTNSSVTFLNARTCGIYKNGQPRYKKDPKSGKRIPQIDNELAELADAYAKGTVTDGISRVDAAAIANRHVLVPRYYDQRWDKPFADFLADHRLSSISLGELEDQGNLVVRQGHGSPPNDQRSGSIPYVKVSDIRALRVNVNPTNLVTREVAKSFWRGDSSKLEPWDLITPNRASSNIGEFGVLLPGEQEIVLTKEVLVFRAARTPTIPGLDAFYLLWALCLAPVRSEWHRVVLMQTNREDVGNRYREIRVPLPRNASWARSVASPFRKYFLTLDAALVRLRTSVSGSKFQFVPSVAKGLVEQSADSPDDYEEQSTTQKLASYGSALLRSHSTELSGGTI